MKITKGKIIGGLFLLLIMVAVFILLAVCFFPIFHVANVVSGGN